MGEIPMTGSSLPPEARAHEAIIARWRRRSRIVAFWRIVLPLSIFAITLALAGWIVARSVLDSPIGAVIVEATRMMTNPKFYDRDQHDRAYLITAAKAYAVLNGQYHVSCDDVSAVALPILRHRLIPNFAAQSEGLDSDAIVKQVIAAIPKDQKLK